MAGEVRLGAFLLSEPLARGGMSTVWRATHDGGTHAAIKVAMGGEHAGWSARSVRLEARAIGTLDHPHVVQVFDAGVVDPAAAEASGGGLPAEQPWIAMELADAGDLGSRIRRLNWATTLDVLLDLLDALAHAHARGVLHRDLKPANVLFRREREGVVRALLSDFGIGWLQEEGQPIEGGTPAFMAPEQLTLRGHEEGPWTDLYALGCLCWAVVCGRVPYRGPDAETLRRAHCEAPIPALSPRFPVPERLNQWLRGLMAKHPRDRFQRAIDAAWALSQLGEAESTGVDLTALDLETERWEVPSSQRTTLKLEGLARGGPMQRSGREVDAAPPFPERWQTEQRSPPRAAGPGLVGLREPPLVGQHAERDDLWSALERATRGWTGVMGVQGPSASHPDRLARWLAQRAHEVGLAVHRVTHSPVPSARDGLRGMLAEHFGVARLAPEELEGAVQQQLTDQEDATSAWMREAVLELLQPDRGTSVLRSAVERYAVMLELVRTMCDGRPLLLCLDGVEHGQDALDFAGFLMDHPERMPAVVLLTATELSGRAVELVERSEGRVLSLSAPDESGVRAALAGLLPLAPGVADAVLEVSGSDPDLGLEWLHLHRERLRSSAEGLSIDSQEGAPLPTVDEAWARRLDALPEGLRRAVQVAALLGPHVPWEEWRAVCERLSLPADAAAVQRLLSDRLVVTRPQERGFSLVHPRLRSNLQEACEDTPWGERAHRACADALEAQGWGSALRRARHLQQVGELIEGARVLLAAARGLVHSDRWLAQRLIEAWHDQAVRVLERDDPDWGHGLMVLVDVRRSQVQLDEHRSAVEALVAWGRRTRDLGALARGLEEQSRACRASGQLDDALALARDSVQYAEEHGDPEQLADSLAALAEAHRRLGDSDAAEEGYRRAFEEGRGRSRRWAALSLAYTLGEQGELARARRVLDACRKELGPDTSPLDRALLLHALGENLRMGGRPQAAVRLFREARELERPAGRMNRTLEVNLGLALLQAHHDEEALDRFERLARRGDRLPLSIQVIVRTSLVVLHLRGQRIDRVTEALDALEALPSTGASHDALGLLVHAGDALEATARPGMARRVLRVARAQAELLQDDALLAELDDRLASDDTSDTTSP